MYPVPVGHLGVKLAVAFTIGHQADGEKPGPVDQVGKFGVEESDQGEFYFWMGVVVVPARNARSSGRLTQAPFVWLVSLSPQGENGSVCQRTQQVDNSEQQPRR
jgi:hypothetical protein